MLWAIALLAVPAVASAQWETPNRGFHKAAVFRLEGRHLTVPCASCHMKGQVQGTPVLCADCHWFRRQDDPYRTRLGMACEQCHQPTSWTAVKWDHAAATGVPLNGAHKTLSCDTCHKNAMFTGVTLSCGVCHQKEYNATKTPNHLAAGFPTQCELCHRPSDASFTQGRFDHNSTFPLQGVHATQTCAACHANGIYKGTPRDCMGCHRKDYDKTTSPNHAAAGFSMACEVCHRVTDPTFKGSGATFNHNQFFPLVGVHTTQTCTACHANGVYKGTPTACIGCHRTDYDRTTTPNHAAAGFSTACDSCHKPTDPSFKATATFNHNQYFALVGLHATQACTACHANGVYKGTPRDCLGCHRNDYNRTTSPNHASAGFSTACDSCHKATDNSWQGPNFNHASVFALVGVHATQTCSACHINGVFKGTPRDCVGCHRTNYDRTTSPNHASAGFSTQCDSCHKPTDPSWQGPNFNHSSIFALVGVHATQACSACHINGVYHGTPRDCYTCHRTNYDRTTTPAHAAAGFSTACDSCHKATDANWLSATFNHNQFFALVGVHATQACSACHINGVYHGTPRDCYTCHRTNYNNTRTPNHVAAGFPTTCDTCHKATDATWLQGTFNHTWFPIASGRHSGNACSACHTNPSNYAGFSCTTSCHARTQTDSNHHGVNGYVYDSNRCYACHPNGRAG
jgi:hypothetical protein